MTILQITHNNIQQKLKSKYNFKSLHFNWNCQRLPKHNILPVIKKSKPLSFRMWLWTIKHRGTSPTLSFRALIMASLSSICRTRFGLPNLSRKSPRFSLATRPLQCYSTRCNLEPPDVLHLSAKARISLTPDEVFFESPCSIMFVGFKRNRREGLKYMFTEKHKNKKEQQGLRTLHI